MKKNIFKLMAFLLVSSLAFMSCTEEEVLKSDYDYTMNPANAPAGVVTVGVSDTSVVSASLSGSVAADKTLKDWGMVYYTQAMLESETFLVASAKDTSFNFNFKVSVSGLVPNTNYLCKAYAVNNDGIAYGEQKAFKTKPAKALPFEIKSTDPVSTWQAIPFVMVDADGDGKKWGLSYLDVAKTKIGLKSYSWSTTALKPENYVVFPPLQLGAAAAKIEMEVQAGDKDYPAEKYKVIISTAPISSKATAATGEILLTETIKDNVANMKTINIPAKYNGKVVWISVCHFDCTDQYFMSINSFKVY